jgi:hypothetical protein
MSEAKVYAKHLSRAVELLRLLTGKGAKQATGLGWNERLRMAREFLAEQREHTASRECWCGPTVEYTDPDTGASVLVHKELQ